MTGVKALIVMREQFGPCGWGGPLQPHAVGPVRLKRTWLPHDTAKTDGLKQGEGRRIQLCCYSRVTIPCDLWPFLHFSSSGGHSLVLGCSTSVWNKACLIGNGLVEIDA